jgi:hypothetical protein
MTLQQIDLTDATMCRYCGAPAGKPCKTKKGMLADRPHECRLVWMVDDDPRIPSE